MLIEPRIEYLSVQKVTPAHFKNGPNFVAEESS